MMPSAFKCKVAVSCVLSNPRHSAPICWHAVQTLCCGNTVSDHLVQVTGADVRLVDATTRQLVHQWRPPAGLQINVASVSPTQARPMLHLSAMQAPEKPMQAKL